MAKPRVFVSSTYYDLKYIRSSIEQFIEQIGYEPILFESGDIPFSHDIALDASCYREIGLCHIFVLVIGGRYGSPASTTKPAQTQEQKAQTYEYYNSVTKKEYETARKQDIPIYIFIEKGVMAEFQTYKKNKDRQISYAHVDHENVFKLIEDIQLQQRNNLTKEFSTSDDIIEWLRSQWAGLLANFISQKREELTVGQIKSQIDSLTSVVNGLKTYSEKIIQKVASEESTEIIKTVDKEVQHQKIESLITGNKLFQHLINSHNLALADIEQVITQSPNLKTLRTKLKSKLLPKTCGSLSSNPGYLQAEIEIINKIRNEHGIEPIDNEDEIVTPSIKTHISISTPTKKVTPKTQTPPQS